MPSALALDVGEKRIGVAVSESWVIASTLPAIIAPGRRAALDAVEALVTRYDAEVVLIGLPVLESGVEGEQAQRTRAFGRSLARRLPKLHIEYWDERYTSVEAKRILGPADRAPGRVDSVAAAVILQEFLDHRSERKDFSADDGTKPNGPLSKPPKDDEER
ncbi:Holliday junction resolvase RuvX [bacterium]|nr:Holliday junction resolvase RuvX [bacterium]